MSIISLIFSLLLSSRFFIISVNSSGLFLFQVTTLTRDFSLLCFFGFLNSLCGIFLLIPTFYLLVLLVIVSGVGLCVVLKVEFFLGFYPWLLCELPGRFKAWLFQHAVLPRILWPLLVYDIPITTVESLERAISNRLRRWLGLPRCLSGTALYGNSNALRLPCSSLEEEFKISKTRGLLQYTESEDPKVAAAGIQIRSGRKWSARRELQVAEERLRHTDILGSIAKGRAGLVFFPSTHTISAKVKERRHLILEEVREGVEEGRYGKMVGLSQQGAWTRWEDVEMKRVTWSDCWRPDFNEIRFLIKSVYDELPSPTNLHIWGKIETPNCQLCARKGSLSLVVAQKLWVIVGTVGVTIKNSR